MNTSGNHYSWTGIKHGHKNCKLRWQKKETTTPYYEWKYMVPLQEMGELRRYLSHYCPRPNRYASGKNITIYYDSLSMESLREGVDGDRQGKKLRLRWYETTDAIPSYSLECKENIGDKVGKVRLRFSPTHRLPLLDLDYLIQLAGYDDLADVLSKFRSAAADYMPRLMVNYQRERFILPGYPIRANLDTNVMATRLGVSHSTTVTRTELLRFAVFEIKSSYPIRIPNHLARIPLNKTPISKYMRLLRCFQECPL